MNFVQTDKAPVPAGHYSQAIMSNGFVFVSGQLPVHSKTKEIPESIEEQTELALTNLENILIEAGSSLEKVVKATVFISDISLWDDVNRVYASKFGNHKPARAIVPTRDLHFGCLIEIDAIASIE